MQTLLYHNVLGDPLDELDRSVGRTHRDTFARHMRVVGEHFRVVSLEQSLLELAAGECDPRTVVVTFDDGYHGVLANAAPVLGDLGMPATVFVVTAYAGGSKGLLHFDEIEAAFRRTRVDVIDLTSLSLGATGIASVWQRAACLNKAKAALKAAPEPRRRELHELVLDQLQVRREDLLDERHEGRFRLLSWAEMRQMQDDGFTIGSHTRTHRTLSRLSPDEVGWEVQGSREDIEAELGTGVPFAYPYGGAEHRGPFASDLVRRNFTCCFTTDPGTNRPSVDLFALRRIGFNRLRRPEPA